MTQQYEDAERNMGEVLLLRDPACVQQFGHYRAKSPLLPQLFQVVTELLLTQGNVVLVALALFGL